VQAVLPDGKSDTGLHTQWALSLGKPELLTEHRKNPVRWLSNKWTDWQTFYLPFARHFLQSLGAKGEIVFGIDGSQTGSVNTTLMLSVLCGGFAIPGAWVVKKGEKGHFPEEMHTDLLKLVAPICPTGCRLVLLGDGELGGLRLQQWCGQPLAVRPQDILRPNFAFWRRG